MDFFKPKNYNSVSPYFMVVDAERLIELLSNIFDAKIHRRYEKPDGKIMHIEIQIDDSIIMMSHSTVDYPSNRYWMHVYVPDVDATFAKAISLGCEIVDEPRTKANDSDRRGTFKDFAGNMWSVATQN
ncbi:MAG: VOC family protein [Chloroherpetonaceae bacterium]|nr:VOC family protein [Chloroherpetonaceae bacterium]